MAKTARANGSVGRPNSASFLTLTGGLPDAGALDSLLQMYKMIGANGVRETLEQVSEKHVGGIGDGFSSRP